MPLTGDVARALVAASASAGVSDCLGVLNEKELCAACSEGFGKEKEKGFFAGAGGAVTVSFEDAVWLCDVDMALAGASAGFDMLNEKGLFAGGSEAFDGGKEKAVCVFGSDVVARSNTEAVLAAGAGGCWLETGLLACGIVSVALFWPKMEAVVVVC